jgi:hypothetical protein
MIFRTSLKQITNRISHVLYTDEGVIRSYVYDMRRPGTEAVLFDEFSILN